MAVKLEGYRYLSILEESKAHDFFKRHSRIIPNVDEGDSVGGKPIVTGLAEHPITGRLIVPKQTRSRQMRDTAIEAAGLSKREWSIWDLQCKGYYRRFLKFELQNDHNFLRPATV